MNLQERSHRWSALEGICGFSIMSNPGLAFLQKLLGSPESKSLNSSKFCTPFFFKTSSSKVLCPSALWKLSVWTRTLCFSIFSAYRMFCFSEQPASNLASERRRRCRRWRPTRHVHPTRFVQSLSIEFLKTFSLFSILLYIVEHFFKMIFVACFLA